MKMARQDAHTSKTKHSSQRSRERKRAGYRCFIVEAHRTDILNLQDAGILPRGDLTSKQMQDGLQEAFRRAMVLIRDQAVQAMRERNKALHQ